MSNQILITSLVSVTITVITVFALEQTRDFIRSKSFDVENAQPAILEEVVATPLDADSDFSITPINQSEAEIALRSQIEALDMVIAMVEDSIASELEAGRSGTEPKRELERLKVERESLVSQLPGQ